MFSVCFFLVPLEPTHARSGQKDKDPNAVSDGRPVKKVLVPRYGGENLLDPNAWRPWHKGFERRAGIFICDNASNTQVQQGISQAVVLNQTRPEPIVAVAWSKAEGVRGSQNSDYSEWRDFKRIKKKGLP